MFGVNAAYSAPSLVIRAANQVGFGPAGQADIAVENANNSLSYYFSRKHGWGSGLILGSVHKVYSAPSLMVIRGSTSFRDTGSMVIAFEGPNHSLLEAVHFTPTWSLSQLEGKGTLASAPSVAQGDEAAREVEIAYRAPDWTLQVYFPDTSSLEGITAANFTVSSAPVLVVRGSHPLGENDLLFEGTNNTLWYYHAPNPLSALPNFTGQRIAGRGTTFGG